MQAGASPGTEQTATSECGTILLIPRREEDEECCNHEQPEERKSRKMVQEIFGTLTHSPTTTTTGKD